MPFDFPLLTSTVQQPQASQQQQQQSMAGFPLLPPPPSSIVPPSQSSPFTAFPTQPAAPSVTSPVTAQQKQAQMSPGSALQGFGLDVFGLGSPSSLTGGPSPIANQQGSPLLGSKIGMGGGLQQPGIGMGLQQPNMGMGFQQPVMGMGQQPVMGTGQQPVLGMGQQPILGMGLQQPPSAVSTLNADPLAVLNDLFIPLDSIQPGMYMYMDVHRKPSLPAGASCAIYMHAHVMYALNTAGIHHHSFFLHLNTHNLLFPSGWSRVI